MSVCSQMRTIEWSTQLALGPTIQEIKPVLMWVFWTGFGCRCEWETLCIWSVQSCPCWVRDGLRHGSSKLLPSPSLWVNDQPMCYATGRHVSGRRIVDPLFLSEKATVGDSDGLFLIPTTRETHLILSEYSA